MFVPEPQDCATLCLPVVCRSAQAVHDTLPQSVAWPEMSAEVEVLQVPSDVRDDFLESYLLLNAVSQFHICGAQATRHRRKNRHAAVE